MTQQQMALETQADAGFERHRKSTRRDVFLAETEQSTHGQIKTLGSHLSAQN